MLKVNFNLYSDGNSPPAALEGITLFLNLVPRPKKYYSVVIANSGYFVAAFFSCPS